MQANQNPLQFVLIKPPGPDCNMACTYCFYLEKKALFPDSGVHRMNEDVLAATIVQVMTQGLSSVSFGWQGGEPTLMGVPFFQKAVELQKRHGREQTVGNGLQTNGLLIDEVWCAFLKDQNFLVGLSLDGTEHIHDRYRLLRSGQSSWEKVVGSAKRMLDADVAVNALIVLNEYSAQFPEEIYQFHKDLGLTHMQFIPCIEPVPHQANKPTSFSVSGEQYGTCLCTLFDLWMADFKDGTPTTSIRYFESVFFHYVDMRPPECTFMPECGNYLVVEHNGDVFSCDFFVEERWRLGNVMEEQLSGILNSNRQQEFGEWKADLVADCHACDWLRYCRGGCTKDRLCHPREKKLNHLCQAYKMFFHHADERLKALATEWKQKQVKAATQSRTLGAIQRGEIKTGRNDPCPCGSGKKFKRCCGRQV